MKRLKDKVAIVTGAGQGFGQGIAETFAREGAFVAVVDLNLDKAREVAKAIGRRATAIKCDVSKAKDVERMFARVMMRFGRLDFVINNAGTTHRNKPVLEVSEDEFDRMFAVNVKSIYLTTRAALPIFRQQGEGGVIVNIGSTAGIRPRPGLTWYNATKGAVNLVTKSLAVELAPEKVRVCALAPVAGETPLLASFMGQDTPEIRAKFVASIPLGRFSTPADIANATLFLCSQEAEFLTGVVLEVDGGRCV